MEAFIIADACIQASADRVTLVAPHLPYQRQDRRSTDKITGAEKREPLSAKLTLRLLKESGYSGLITVDPHFDQYRSALPNDFQLETPTARIAIANHIIKSGLLEKKVTVISPDYGGGKRAEILAKDLGITYGGLCRKQREKPGIIGNMTVLPEEGITLSEYDFALILDDIIDSGGTLEKCYQALKAKEVKDIIVAAPHGIFTKGAQQRLLDTGIKLITTNAIPQVYDPRIEVIDLSTILAVTIHCIATGHGSISRKLFNINEYRALEEKLSR
jgi:ribose-phosphate pyrophosphokinase